eukprot:2443599-Pleurochrysis_carterae.AAC.1
MFRYEEECSRKCLYLREQASSNWATEGDMESRESQRSLRTYAPQRAYRRPRMHMRACPPEHVHANVWACGR